MIELHVRKWNAFVLKIENCSFSDHPRHDKVKKKLDELKIISIEM